MGLGAVQQSLPGKARGQRLAWSRPAPPSWRSALISSEGRCALRRESVRTSLILRPPFAETRTASHRSTAPTLLGCRPDSNWARIESQPSTALSDARRAPRVGFGIRTFSAMMADHESQWFAWRTRERRRFVWRHATEIETQTLKD